MTGRLTLNWANKDKALLSKGEQGYEWVDRDDPRVREVRLLDDVGVVGEVLTGSTSGIDNLLIRGDSVDALRALVRTPEYAEQYRGKVKLVYIDPPFNTGQAFEHYDDSLEHSVWLGMMRERLVLIRELLAPDGSVWVHLDDAEMAYCRVLMDEVFGRQNFRNTVIWKRTTGKSSAVRDLGTMHETVLFYSRTEAMMPNPYKLPYSAAYIASKYSNQDERGAFQLDNLTAPGTTAGTSGKPWAGVDPTMKGRHWIAPNVGGVLDELGPSATTQQKLDRLLEAGYIRPAQTDGQWPRFKRYLDPNGGVNPGDTWTDIPVLNSQELERNGFSTQKPEMLLERILRIATNPGDIVLDCFAGSGTTAAVAHKMGRRWVTVELSENTSDTFTKPRLAKVVNGEDPGGITESAGWAGGGGFRDLRVHASVWDVISDNLGTAVFQSPEVDDATLARSVAAQLGYRLIEHPVFVGAKGRSRLAVASGVVDAVAVADIVSSLADGETTVIAALSHTEDAASTLAEMSRGSRILRMPSGLFPALSKVTR